MDDNIFRHALDRLIRERRENYGALSRLIGRNPAYIQQYIKRGTPRKLDEEDRRILARYFGVEESLLGGPALARGASGLPVNGPDLSVIPRLDTGASAGAGALEPDERQAGAIGFDPKWLKMLGLSPQNLSIIRVDGESMARTLDDGDMIMVDHSDGASRLRDGIYVLRFDAVLMVKRVAIAPRSSAAGGEGHAARSRRVLTISSDNAQFPSWPDVDPALVDIVGRVVWVGRRMV